VEVRIHKRRAEQLALRVKALVRWGVQQRRYFDNFAVVHRNRHGAAPVGQGGVLNEQVKHDGVLDLLLKL
jgi:hypothetical protein